jgi:hypothetical protein
MKLEKTCKCIKDLNILPEEDSVIKRSLNFIKNNEYQVDINTFSYRVYLNSGWYSYVDLSNDNFEKYFKLIE